MPQNGMTHNGKGDDQRESQPQVHTNLALNLVAIGATKFVLQSSIESQPWKSTAQLKCNRRFERKVAWIGVGHTLSFNPTLSRVTLVPSLFDELAPDLERVPPRRGEAWIMRGRIN